MIAQDDGIHFRVQPRIFLIQRIDDLDADDFGRIKILLIQVIAVQGTAHATQEQEIIRAGGSPVIHIGFVAVNGVDEITGSEMIQVGEKRRGMFHRNGLFPEVFTFLGIVDGRAVHDDEGHADPGWIHLHEEKGRGMVGHEADFCAVIIELIQLIKGSAGDVGHMVRHQIMGMEEKQPVFVFPAGKPENVDADGNGCADKNINQADGGLPERILNIRKRDHDTEKDDGGQTGRIRHANQHTGIQGDQDAQGHEGVQDGGPFAQNGEHQHEKQKQETQTRSDKGAGQPVQGIFPGITDIGLQADDGRNNGLGLHGFPIVAPQIVDDQADKDRQTGLDNALSQVRQMPDLSGGKNLLLHTRPHISGAPLPDNEARR